jgi:hypothetical protein
MLLKLKIDDRFLWLKSYTPSARRKILEYALDKLSVEEIHQLLSLPAPHFSEKVEPEIEEKPVNEIPKIDASNFEI